MGRGEIAQAHAGAAKQLDSVASGRSVDPERRRRWKRRILGVDLRVSERRRLQPYRSVLCQIGGRRTMDDLSQPHTFAAQRAMGSELHLSLQLYL